jgi:signal peptidase I
VNDDLDSPGGSVEPVPEPDLEPTTPVPPEPEDAPTPKKHTLPFWLELPLLIIAALAIAVVIKTFFLQAFWIPSSSMEDTLLINDRVMVNKLAYRVGDLQRGHIVVFDDPRGGAAPQEGILEATRRNISEAVGLSVPRTEFIKRVVGLPGERVEIIDNQVLIDGTPIEEPYLKTGWLMPDFGPVVVPAGEMFVMGDNRNSSQDSRYFGSVPTDTVVGRAFVIMWPPSRWSGL